MKLKNYESILLASILDDLHKDQKGFLFKTGKIGLGFNSDDHNELINLREKLWNWVNTH